VRPRLPDDHLLVNQIIEDIQHPHYPDHELETQSSIIGHRIRSAGEMQATGNSTKPAAARAGDYRLVLNQKMTLTPLRERNPKRNDENESQLTYNRDRGN